MPVLVPLESRLERLYPGRGAEVAHAVRAMVHEYRTGNVHATCRADPWNERDVVLITYADQLRSPVATPLATLAAWLHATGLEELFSIVHLLPFFPSSSDDGFAVIDFLQVDPGVGDWDDVERLGEQVELMFDLVLNHVSQQSEWFAKYLLGTPPYAEFFIEADPTLDYAEVVRPRSLALLTPVQTIHGTRHVWTTFSADQVDLNYANPEVLLRMLRVLLEYARRGARIVRLDAVAFLWKSLGTSCLHLPETHEVVRLMRDVVTQVYPDTLLLTETNVPHAENISYFGNGNETHMVYQFSLPPLLLDAFVNADAIYLRHWLAHLDPPPPGCTFLNFTASHDGIGVRPLEGLVPPERLERLVAAVEARGGRISTRRRADGSDAPYELNISYVDALSPTAQDETPDIDLHVRRFLTSQALMLSLPGVPAVYFHSLVGTRNDHVGVAESGINRRINRHKYELPELETNLADRNSLAALVFAGYCKLLKVRQRQPAFHPDASVRVIEEVPNSVLALIRMSPKNGSNVFVAVNFGHQAVTILPDKLSGASSSVACHDLFDGRDRSLCVLAAGAFAWLSLG